LISLQSIIPYAQDVRYFAIEHMDVMFRMNGTSR